MADPKPRRRTKASRSEWRDLLDELVLAFDRACQLCGGDDCGNYPLSAHHIVGKDLGGDDVIENLALLGGTGTTKCHGAVQRLERYACSRLRRRMTDRQLAYVVERKSAAFLDRYYPEAA